MQKYVFAFIILQLYLIKLFSYNQSTGRSAELDVEWVYVYYKQSDSYGVLVPIIFQELFVIITMM